MLYEINLYNFKTNIKNISSIFSLTSQARSFRSSTKNNVVDNESIDNTNNSYFYFLDLDKTPAGISSKKNNN